MTVAWLDDGDVRLYPKPWRCELCGHDKGLILVPQHGKPDRIECFTIPACKARQGNP